MGKTISALRKLEGSLAGLYSTLFKLSYFSINAKTAFQKIAMDSMEHEELIRLLESKLDEYEGLVDDEMITLCNSLSEEAMKLSESVKKMTSTEIFGKLRELEKGEELAYQIYQKYMKEAANKKDNVLVLILKGIVEDEELHDKLLSALVN
ncbi:MAG: hypothetical protein RXO33_00425 [Nitrososphaeria archaeon]|jgi:hypothetical protein|nr:hypothetical protein [Nitrososphaerota archaeon]